MYSVLYQGEIFPMCLHIYIIPFFVVLSACSFVETGNGITVIFGKGPEERGRKGEFCSRERDAVPGCWMMMTLGVFRSDKAHSWIFPLFNTVGGQPPPLLVYTRPLIHRCLSRISTLFPMSKA